MEVLYVEGRIKQAKGVIIHTYKHGVLSVGV